MKKLISFVLALILLGAAAYAQELGNHAATMTIEESGPVISVSVDWGDMKFSYTQGAWNPEKHEYNQGGSISPVDDSNYVIVTNDSNVDVTVTCSLSVTQEGISGSVDNGGIRADKTLAAWAEGAEYSHTFRITFSASDLFDSTALSSDTVSLGTVSVCVVAA